MYVPKHIIFLKKTINGFNPGRLNYMKLTHKNQTKAEIPCYKLLIQLQRIQFYYVRNGPPLQFFYLLNIGFAIKYAIEN